ncbi:hypothetical protein D3C72_2444820 [compost metagenome]
MAEEVSAASQSQRQACERVSGSGTQVDRTASDMEQQTQRLLRALTSFKAREEVLVVPAAENRRVFAR